MNRTALLFLLIFLSGCGPFTASPETRDSTADSVDERVSAADLWLTLANAVERGSITTSQRLARFVVVLARHGDLSASDVAAFDAAFPSAAKTDRALDSADATRLRQIPQSE